MFYVRCLQPIEENESSQAQLVERPSGPAFVTYRHQVCLGSVRTGTETVRPSRIRGCLRLPASA